MTVRFLASMLVPELPVMTYAAGDARTVFEVATAGEVARGATTGSMLEVADWQFIEGGLMVKVKEVQA